MEFHRLNIGEPYLQKTKRLVNLSLGVSQIMTDETFETYVKFIGEHLTVFESINHSIKNNIELNADQLQFLEKFHNLKFNPINTQFDEQELNSAIYDQKSLKEIQKNELDNIRKESKIAQSETQELQEMSQRIMSLQNKLQKITNERSLIEVEIKNQIIQLSDQREKQREIIKQLLSYYQN
jgi:hypothetical protein